MATEMGEKETVQERRAKAELELTGGTSRVGEGGSRTLDTQDKKIGVTEFRQSTLTDAPPFIQPRHSPVGG